MPGEAVIAPDTRSGGAVPGTQRNANWRKEVTKRTSAKYKLDRRMGENVFGRPKSPVNRREYGPGQHGQRRKGKLSDYGIQLRAKQNFFCNDGDTTEKQFKKNYVDAIRMKGD